ncbi:MAG: hypothetical protein ABIO86_21545 [Sphingomonas sp.]
MPIILYWNILAAPSIGTFNRMLSGIRTAGELLEKWLRRQLEDAEKIDRRTAGFPVFRFYNMAIAAEISSLQRGVITPAVDTTIGAQMARVGQAWNIPDYVGRRITEARLLGNLIGIFQTISQALIDSIDRWATPRAELFDPDNARITDLPGLAVLFFNKIGANRDGILAAGTALHSGLAASAPPIDPQQATTDAAAAQAAGTSETAESTLKTTIAGFAAQTEQALQVIAGALFIVPAIGGLALAMAGDIVQALRIAVLDRIQEIEASVMQWRREFYASFYRTLNAWVDGTVLFMLTLRDFVLDQLRYYTQFGLSYLDGIASGISAFAAQLMTFWQGTATLIGEIVAYLDRIMHIDIGDVIHQALVLFERIIDFFGDQLWDDSDKAPRYHAPAATPVTLGDFFTNEGTGVGARTQLGEAGRVLLLSYNGANWISRGVNMGLGSWIADMHLPTLAEGAIDLVGEIARRRPPSAGATPSPPLPVLPTAPADVVTTIITPLRTGLTTAIADIGTAVQTQVGNIFTAFGTLAEGVAERAEASALAAFRLGSLGQYERIVAGSEAIVLQAFPTPAESPATGLEAVARAFSLWLSGGFETIGSILNGYLAFLVQEWRERIDANADATFDATATSPRKLLAAARLGRVHVPEMRIVFYGSATTQQAANDIAVSFQGAVRDAYATGDRRLQELRASAAAAAG